MVALYLFLTSILRPLQNLASGVPPHLGAALGLGKPHPGPRLVEDHHPVQHVDPTHPPHPHSGGGRVAFGGFPIDFAPHPFGGVQPLQKKKII